MGLERFVPRWEIEATGGAVVVIDVIRAFTTAAYAFAAGARVIRLVDSVEEALAYKKAHPDVLVMGEDGGRMPVGFDLSNSPVMASSADLDGRTLVQRTSAGTRGVVAAKSATRMWCASLVCASATASAVSASGLGDPTYVITGRTLEEPDRGADDMLTAQFIEGLLRGNAVSAASTAAAVAGSSEAAMTLLLGDGHVHPDDIEFATRVDAFDFAMEVDRSDGTPVIWARR